MRIIARVRMAITLMVWPDCESQRRRQARCQTVGFALCRRSDAFLYRVLAGLRTTPGVPARCAGITRVY